MDAPPQPGPDSPRPDRCPYCRSDVALATGAQVYPQRPELADRQIWRCVSCDAHVGCHKAGARVVGRGGTVILSDGTLPMGSLANAELRAARVETHRLMDTLSHAPACMSRAEAYAWMARLLELPLEEAHVAALSFEACVKVMHGIEDLMRSPSEPTAAPDATRWLAQAGIGHSVAEDGHLVIEAGDETLDYWPDTQRWSVRDQLVGEQEGLHALILYCVQGRTRNKGARSRGDTGSRTVIRR